MNNEAETACRARAAVLLCQPALRQKLMRRVRMENNHTFKRAAENKNVGELKGYMANEIVLMSI